MKLDDGIQYAVEMLNAVGVRTSASCDGVHKGELFGYITFAQECDPVFGELFLLARMEGPERGIQVYATPPDEIRFLTSDIKDSSRFNRFIDAWCSRIVESKALANERGEG